MLCPHKIFPSSVVSLFLFCCHSVLGLVPVLIPHLTETILPGITRTTEVGSEATTGATGDPTTTVEETEAITNAVITRTGEEEEAMATNPIGKAVVAAAAVEVGMIDTMTRTTTHTALGGGAHAHLRSGQAAAAVPVTLTARLQGNLGAPGAPATPRVPVLHHHVIAAARASIALRMQS